MGIPGSIAQPETGRLIRGWAAEMNDPMHAGELGGDRLEWTARSGESVTIGDTVALSLLEHPDAIGVIEAAADDGGVSCVLIECESCPAGQLVIVDEDQLLVLMEKGGGSTKERFDYDI